MNMNFEKEKSYLYYEKLKEKAGYEILGRTLAGREIRMYRFGKEPKVLLCACSHAREWITTALLTELALRENEKLSFDLIPCLNPDGMALATDGLSSVENEEIRKELLKLNGGKKDFSMWKANLRGVDINVNFDADWGEGKMNVTFPGAENYIGRTPESEEETKAAVKAMKNGYALTVCYHSLGEEVYWGYENNFKFYDEAKEYATKVGYKLKRSEYSTGGMKDYYSLNYEGLGLTVEVGEEKYGHPYPEKLLGNILKKHEGSIKLLCDLGERINGKIYANSLGGGKKSL